MADDLEKTEESYLDLNEKGTRSFFYAKRYATKEKSLLRF
ncbi:MAG: hypothetical protein QG559_1541 [Campylobacterota bacterium]|nr:hypothetical protein [Campylobacterota bacterium]